MVESSKYPLKTIEQASLTSDSSAGRVGQVIPGSKEEHNQIERQFGFKEIGTLLGIVALMVGIVWYGVYARGSRSESRISSIAEPVTVPPVAHASPATGAFAQPIQVSQPLLVSTVPPATNPESGPAETQTESKHADIYFDFGKSRLRADATAILQQHADILKKEGKWALLIQGYADQYGPTEYNRTLAMRRAESVRQFLAELGVPGPSMKVVSLGKDSAICDGQTRPCQRLNRRVHVEMVKLEIGPMAAPITMSREEVTELTPASDQTPLTSESQAGEEPAATFTDQP